MKSTKEATYSEVYSFLNYLGKEYIDRVPKKLYNLIKNNKDENYNFEFDNNKPIQDQPISNEALAFVCLLHLNYWCNSEEEKRKIKNILDKNDIELREKYSVDNIFNSSSNSKIIKPVEEPINETTYNSTIANTVTNNKLMKYNENFFYKLLRKIKNFFIH